MRKSNLSLAILSTLLSYQVNAATELDYVTVTATKEERKALEVSQSVDVVSGQTIEDKNARNINEILKTMPGVTAVSKNGGYDSRLIIRGAGLKAPYGVREIMVLRDGVPMTDPDSFTRFDFIDIDDIDSLEVFKGPGSIVAANASGGVVSVRSRSVFDMDNDYIKLGAGSETSRNAAIHKTWQAGDSDNVSVQFSRRQSDNDWREWNTFDTTQLSLKHGHFFADDSMIETELSYQTTHLKLPGSLNEAGFAYYKETGETLNDIANTDSAFSKSARDSKTLFFNTRYKTTLSNGIEFNPQFYVNQWEHLHPVTGFINDSKDNYVVGTDLAFNRQHQLFGNKASQVFGLTMRGDVRNDSKKYKYADIVEGFTTTPFPHNEIIDVTSNNKGDLANVEDASSILTGIYIQQTFSPADRWSMDLGLRYDHLEMDISGNQIYQYDWSTHNYDTGNGAYEASASYDLFSPKFSANYKLSQDAHLYGSISGSQQAPTDSEISKNIDYSGSAAVGELKASTALQFEIGYKLSNEQWQTTLALYQIDLADEIVGVKEEYSTAYYVNAGQTQKRGAEFNTAYQITPALNLGATASLQDYQYLDYQDAGNDYSGNKVRFIPEQQYSVFASYKHKGYQGRLEGLGFGSYFMDDANTEKYQGYEMVVNAMVAYAHKEHKLQLNVNNLFDMRYAEEVSLSDGDYSYTPGAPRNIQLNYRYQF
jgi:iron complex outermembrane receptor protein